MSKIGKREVPMTRSQQRRLLGDHLSFAAAEAYKLLRTNLMFALPDSGGCRVVGVTSADDGKMLDPEIKDTTKDGIVAENGSLYYYKDGVLNYAGLIEIDGSYYYVKTSGEVVHGRSYWISKTNGLMPERSYTFANDGRMVNPGK